MNLRSLSARFEILNTFSNFDSQFDRIIYLLRRMAFKKRVSRGRPWEETGE